MNREIQTSKYVQQSLETLSPKVTKPTNKTCQLAPNSSKQGNLCIIEYVLRGTSSISKTEKDTFTNSSMAVHSTHM